MFWETLWALILGFTLSGAVQAFVLAGGDAAGAGRPRPAARSRRATRLRHGVVELLVRGVGDGEVAVPEGRRLRLRDGLHVRLDEPRDRARHRALRAAWAGSSRSREFVGGAIMIVLCSWLAGYVLKRRELEAARARLGERRARARLADRHGAGVAGAADARRAGWSDAASYTIADITMLRKELRDRLRRRRLPRGARADGASGTTCSSTGTASGPALENVIVGPFIAFISFVCSIGNVPMAAALWHGGISFGGVISFIFADLIALPLVLIYRKYYGGRLTLRLARWLLGRDGRGRARGRGPLPRRSASIPTTRPETVVPTELRVELHDVPQHRLPARARRPLLAGPEPGAPRRRRRLRASTPSAGCRWRWRTPPPTRCTATATYYFCSDHCRQRFEADPARRASVEQPLLS